MQPIPERAVSVVTATVRIRCANGNHREVSRAGDAKQPPQPPEMPIDKKQVRKGVTAR